MLKAVAILFFCAVAFFRAIAIPNVAMLVSCHAELVEASCAANHKHFNKLNFVSLNQKRRLSQKHFMVSLSNHEYVENKISFDKLKMTFSRSYRLLSQPPDFEEEPPDSIITISTVTIASNRLTELGLGNKTETIDSAQLLFQQSGTLTDVLQNESAVFIRTYGLGSLANASVRGGASTHTAILWNGFNLQSPMNSLYDMSLIPAFFLDDVKLQHGSSGALFGSGAVGGSIHLDNKNIFAEGLRAKYAASYGSFGNWMQGGSISFGNKKWYANTRAFYHAAENNFRFQNIAEFGSPMQRLTNAAMKQYGILHEQGFNFSNYKRAKNLLYFKLWQQHNEREIPPSMTMRESQQQQTDNIWRATLNWEFTVNKNWETIFRNAYFNEKIHFTDPSIGLDEKYTAHTFISEWENKIYIGSHHLLNIGSNYTFHSAITDNYAGGNPTQNRGAIFAAYRYSSRTKKIVAVGSLRQEFIDRQRVPLTPSFAGEYRVLNWLMLKSNVSASYRVPNFNDWYWTQGGNPDLKPEKGWSQELGLVAEKKSQHFSFQTEVTGFSSVINNRIIWLPNNINIWTPENVSKVWSRGMEGAIKAGYEQKNYSMHFSMNYQWVKATNNKQVANAAEAGKQLIYMPEHRANFILKARYKKTSLQYHHQFNGEMFITADNNKSLPLFHVANIMMAQHITLKQYALQVYAKANNIFNTTYQVIAWRPMPLVHFEAGIQFSFHYKKQKQ